MIFSNPITWGIIKKQKSKLEKLIIKHRELFIKVELLEKENSELVKKANSVQFNYLDPQVYAAVMEEHAQDISNILSKTYANHFSDATLVIPTLIKQMRYEKAESMKKDIYIKNLLEEIEKMKEAAQ